MGSGMDNHPAVFLGYFLTGTNFRNAVSLKHIYDNPEAGHDQVSFCIDSLHPEAGMTEWQFRIKAWV